jgi:hypothetical protein
MDSGTRLIKTAKGREEIDQRRYKLASKLRTLLILVDGARSVSDLTNDGRKLGAPDDALILLMRDGFVAPVTVPVAAAVAEPTEAAQQGAAPPSSELKRFRAAQQFMNETAVDNMGGLKKFTFTLKLERCSVRQDLVDLVDDYELSLTKSIGKDAADVLVGRLRALLA